MLTTLAREAAASSRLATRVLVGEGVPFVPPSGVDVVRIPRGRELDGLATAAAASDWLILVAPETAGILEQRLRRVAGTSCRVAGPSPAFTALTADKHATMLTLAGGGVPVPAGRLLAAGERPPEAFRRPLVRKHRCSAGCDGLAVAWDKALADEAAVHDERLEAYVPGTPVSVSVLCGPAGITPLPPVMQRLSDGAMPAYLGGRMPVPRPLARRATALAVRAVEVVELGLAALHRGQPSDASEPPPAAGWVGVDMILGDRDDGRGDRVLEINPRLTTSLVGLVQWSTENLVEAMLTAAAGGVPQLGFRDVTDGPFEFAAALPC